MSWSYSRALVVEYSEACSSDTELSALLNTTPTPDQYYWPDKTTEHSRLSRFGMTCVPLTGSHGEELLMSYLGDFHARTSVKPERGQESLDRAPDYGNKWSELLAKYDHATSSWKTAQCSLFEDLELSLETWPRSGSMLNGVCYLQPMLAPLTYAKEYGSWPTPTCSDVYTGNLKSSQQKPGSMHSVTLPQAVAKRAMWQTPSATDSARGGRMTENMTGQSLVQMVNTRTWPTATATATAYKGWSPKHNRAESDDRLDYTVERESFRDGQKTPPMRLNPDWVEWLMGWPIGQTALKPLGTDKFREFELQHGICSMDKAA